MEERRIPVTREGYERLKEELETLKEVRRPEIVAAVAEARSHGDLRENAAYDAARQDQAMNEKRIADLENMLRNADIVEGDGSDRPSDEVGIGNTVVVDFDGDEERFTIVGAIEAKPTSGMISNESPIGQALIGRKVGDKAVVATPGGQTTLKIKAIE